MPHSSFAWTAAAALVLLFPPVFVQGDRFSQVVLELSGPLDSVALEIPDRARADSTLSLRAGERVEHAMFLPVESSAVAPRVSSAGAGVARVIGWDDAAAQRRREEWNSLPVALRMRPRVAARRVDGEGAPAGALLVAAAGLVAALACRRKPRWALAAGSTCAVAAAVWTLVSSAPRSATRVIEVDGATGRSVAVDVARDRASGVTADDLRWEATPDHAELAVVSAPSGALELRGDGVDLRIWRAFESAERELAFDDNRWGLLSPVWRRDGQGGWHSAAAWRVGAPWRNAAAQDPSGEQPAADEAPPAPPGWIQPGLPMGRQVVIGRWIGADGAGSDPREVWVRWIGG